MSISQKEIRLLREEIADAFKDVSRENGVSLSEADVIDDYGSAKERASARAQDKDTTWHDVPARDIASKPWCLGFLDEIGFRYYLPAVMLWTMKNAKQSDSETADRLVSILGHGWYRKHFRLLTPAQSAAVAYFLQFRVNHCEDADALKALDKHWRSFL